MDHIPKPRMVQAIRASQVEKSIKVGGKIGNWKIYSSKITNLDFYNFVWFDDRFLREKTNNYVRMGID